MSSLVTAESWFIFHVLELYPDHVSWLDLYPIMWKSSADLCLYETFVKGMSVVNDPAERSIKLTQDFISRFHDEQALQNNLLVVDEHRMDFSSDTSGKMARRTLDLL